VGTSRLAARIARDFAVTALLALISIAAAGEDLRPRSRGESQARAARILDEYLLSKVQGALGLSDAVASQVIPLVAKLQKDRRNLLVRRRVSLRAIRDVLQSGRATELGISDLMAEVRATERESAVRLKNDLDAIDRKLTAVQQARYRILEDDVRRRVRRFRSTHGSGQDPSPGAPGRRVPAGRGREGGGPPFP
jgi:hypothetical protein